VPWGFTKALGTEPLAGPAVPSGCCREFPLGTFCAEKNPARAESNYPFGKAMDSGSDILKDRYGEPERGD
jgi:hypothetical protein